MTDDGQTRAVMASTALPVLGERARDLASPAAKHAAAAASSRRTLSAGGDGA